MFRIGFFTALLFITFGCQKPTTIVLNEEFPTYEIDKQGNVSVNDNKLDEKTEKKLENTVLSFQSNRMVINFSNGSSLILKPSNTSCEEWIPESPTECLEEYFLAALCNENENATIVCSNDSVYWEFNIQLSQNKEGINSSSFKMKRLKYTPNKKSLQGKMVLENQSITIPY